MDPAACVQLVCSAKSIVPLERRFGICASWEQKKKKKEEKSRNDERRWNCNESARTCTTPPARLDAFVVQGERESLPSSEMRVTKITINQTNNTAFAKGIQKDSSGSLLHGESEKKVRIYPADRWTCTNIAERTRIVSFSSIFRACESCDAHSGPNCVSLGALLTFFLAAA
jgi:hypothetical protein